ncbi:MAG: response regulator [Asticcacaulis sp.]
MFVEPAKINKLRPHLKHVLLLEPNVGYARMLMDMLRAMGAQEVLHFKNENEALDKAHMDAFTLVFCAHQPPLAHAANFTRNLRRSEAPSRKAPVIMMLTEDYIGPFLREARDAGADEFMKKPVTWADFLKRVEHVAFKSRPWIEAVGYVGPDRRRFNSGEYAGERKRSSDKVNDELQPIEQAVRILRAAHNQYESNPLQARKAMMAQLEVLVPACKRIKSETYLTDIKAVLHCLRSDPPDMDGLAPPIYSLSQFFKIEDRQPTKVA